MDPRVTDNVARYKGQQITPNGVIETGKPMLCPWNCSLQKIDLNGYCRHLVGWTEDGKTMEMREEFMPGRERVGNLIGIVEEDDVLISGTPDRKNRANHPCPTPSHRVYRKTGKAPVKDDGTHITRKVESVYDQADADTTAA